MELDTHAGTAVLGKHCLVVQELNQPADVSGWDSTLETIKCQTVTGVVVYDHPATGQTYMLVFNQAIYAELLENHLICPMQCWVHGVAINNTPKMFIAEATDCLHTIIVDLGSDNLLAIPLALTGVANTFDVRTPSLTNYSNENKNSHPHDQKIPDVGPSQSGLGIPRSSND